MERIPASLCGVRGKRTQCHIKLQKIVQADSCCGLVMQIQLLLISVNIFPLNVTSTTIQLVLCLPLLTPPTHCPHLTVSLAQDAQTLISSSRILYLQASREARLVNGARWRRAALGISLCSGCMSLTVAVLFLSTDIAAFYCWPSDLCLQFPLNGRTFFLIVPSSVTKIHLCCCWFLGVSLFLPVFPKPAGISENTLVFEVFPYVLSGIKSVSYWKPH